MLQGFLPRIESMRGIAALTVVGFHVSNQFSASPAFGWFDGFAFRIFTAFFNGVGAVVIFFVLSGFVLARSLDANSNPTRFYISYAWPRRWRRQGLGDSAKPEARSICLSIPLVITREWLPIDARLFGLADLQILEYFAINIGAGLDPGRHIQKFDSSVDPAPVSTRL